MADLFHFEPTLATETATNKTVKGLTDLIAALETQSDAKDTVAFARGQRHMAAHAAAEHEQPVEESEARQ